LLRLMDQSDPLHEISRQAIRSFTAKGHTFVTSLQNIGEFWNVCTRPCSARGGYGLSTQETRKRRDILERAFPVLTDSEGSYPLWRDLLDSYDIRGVQVHDARLVALMQSHGLTDILTFNASDFMRYDGIVAVSPHNAN